MIDFLDKIVYSYTDIIVCICVAALIYTGSNIIVRLICEVPINTSEFIFCLIKEMDPQQYYKEKYKHD